MEPVVDANVEILVVDDDKATCEFIGLILENEGYKVTLAFNGHQALSLLQKTYYHIVISDIQLGEPDGIALLSSVKVLEKERGRPSAVIFITGFGSVDTAVRAIQEGAFDYLSKPIDLSEIEVELKSLVGRAIKNLERAQSVSAKEVSLLSNPQMSMIGKSPQIVKIYRTIAKAAMSRSNVLVVGESGTGKELVARAIHDNSDRAQKPFVAVNCCALTESLLESELFGHVKGSFTGAIGNKRGLFEEANEGTIFLDEIGDISHAIQVKLLRVLQEGEIKPVGATENRRVDVRVVAATHRDLDTFVRDGKFREDLYYRLKVILIETPPLRQRTDDLKELVQHFLARASKRTGKYISAVSEEAMELVSLYPWPGNIRELENAVERAVAMTNTNVLFPEDFPPEIANYGMDDSQPQTTVKVPESSTMPSVPQSLEAMERDHILRTLEETKFNKSKAATILGIDRVTLYRKASRYGIPMRAK